MWLCLFQNWTTTNNQTIIRDRFPFFFILSNQIRLNYIISPLYIIEKCQWCTAIQLLTEDENSLGLLLWRSRLWENKTPFKFILIMNPPVVIQICWGQLVQHTRINPIIIRFTLQRHGGNFAPIPCPFQQSFCKTQKHLNTHALKKMIKNSFKTKQNKLFLRWLIDDHMNS